MSQWLEIAIEIGRDLAGNPLAAEGAWLGDCMVGEADGRPVIAKKDVGVDLYGGSVGIALVLAQLSAATGDQDLANLAASGLRRALAEGHELARQGFLSLHSGACGIALAAVEAGTAIGQPEIVETGLNLGIAAAQAVHAQDMPEDDLIAGKAGTILALLALDAVKSSEELRSAASLLSERIVAQTRDGWWGRTQITPSGVALCGLGHGASGIGWALINAGTELGRSDLGLAGDQMLQFEDGQFDPTRAAWPDLRSRQSDETAEAGWMDAWCHGAFGIGAVRFELWKARREPLRLAQASAALWAARRFVVQAAAAEPVADMTLCHGLAGAAELMLLAFEVTGLAEHLSAARRVGALILRLKERNQGRWTVGLPGGEDVPGLFLGRAGLCALFLRLHDPQAMNSPMLPASRLTGF